MFFFQVLKSHLHLILPILLIVWVVLSLLVIFVFTKKSKPRGERANTVNNNPESSDIKRIVITSQDIKAIAGDDTMTTQVDLARAYLETGRSRLAKKMLDHVLQHGNSSQQRSARELMKQIT